MPINPNRRGRGTRPSSTNTKTSDVDPNPFHVAKGAKGTDQHQPDSKREEVVRPLPDLQEGKKIDTGSGSEHGRSGQETQKPTLVHGRRLGPHVRTETSEETKREETDSGKGITVREIVKWDVWIHKYLFKNRKEISTKMKMLDNALASKKTTIGGIGAVLLAVGMACQGFGDSSIDSMGLIIGILGGLKLAYGMFSARDNDVKSTDAGPGGSPLLPKMLILFLIPLFAITGCQHFKPTPEQEISSLQKGIINCDASIARTDADIQSLVDKALIDGTSEDEDVKARLAKLQAHKAHFEDIKGDFQVLLDRRCAEHPEICDRSPELSGPYNLVPLAPAASGAEAG